MSRQDDYRHGLENRRNILGDEWVDKSLANATDFTADYQNLITRHAWHDIWSRPGLPHKTRRIMVLAVTLATGQWEEFELHVRAAISATNGTGLTPEELKEVLLQNAIYAGVPAANTAFKIAQGILRDLVPTRGYTTGHADAEKADPLLEP